jgi:hypothetical protein
MTPLPVEEISWVGAGWLGGQPGEAAWRILAGGVGVGFVIIIVSYCFTLVTIAPWRRGVLCLLRFALWIALFLILAAPTRIERTYDHPKLATRPLAVLVDRSDSMTALDNRQQRRLDDALGKWRRLEPTARKSFSSVNSFAFAQGVAPVADPTDAGHLPGGRTDLFASLQEVLAKAPTGGWGGVVILTDGLDTSGVEAAEARRVTARAALLSGTPLFFVVGHNRAIEPEFFHLREFNVPAKTVPHSIIRLNAIFESYQTAASTLPVRLAVSGKERPAASVQLESGRHLETWAAEGRADSPGTIVFELRVGTEVARAEVKIEEPPSNQILYDEGAIDWGYRFLADILRRNDTFSVTPMFDFPNPGTALPPGAITQMPSPQNLHPFGFVMLENVVANQLPPAQQQALTRWVNDGGILFFLAPDDAATRGFAGSELEKILPVVFGPRSQDNESEANSERPAVSLRPAASDSRVKITPVKPAQLISFAWEDTPRVHEIFAQTPEGGITEQTPKFSIYAHVDRAKPGAEILARHPTEKGADGKGMILLAVQRYGRGKSVVFTTDALWRWRLGQPSTSRGVELFWGNFFSWLNRDRDAGFYFDHPAIRSTVDQEVTFHLIGSGTKSLRVEATLGDQKIALTELPPDGVSRLFRWRPPATGMWQIAAKNDEKGDSARTWLSADQTPKAGELPAAAPDDELMRSLAEQTSGALLEDVPNSWHREPPPAQLLSETRQPLWHQSWLFAVLLGVYGLEMLLRRKWQLL